MTVGERFALLWIVFAFEAVVLALVAASDTPWVNVALVVGVILGVPLSFVLAVLLRCKGAKAAIALGTLLVASAAGVSQMLFDHINPLVLGVLVLLIGIALWLILPDVPCSDGRAACERCGYPFEGLREQRCPECGRIFGVSPFDHDGRT